MYQKLVGCGFQGVTGVHVCLEPFSRRNRFRVYTGQEEMMGGSVIFIAAIADFFQF